MNDHQGIGRQTGIARSFYRLRQFWLAWRSTPSQTDLKEAQRILDPAQYQLFLQLQPGEQAHSLDVLHRLLEQGENHPDLLTAALLHDIGKVCYPLSLWQRVWIVLYNVPGIKGHVSRKIQPMTLDTWYLAPLIVAEMHPVWGADLAARAGVSPLAVALIRRHQERNRRTGPQSLEDTLLIKLQAVDDES